VCVLYNPSFVYRPSEPYKGIADLMNIN